MKDSVGLVGVVERDDHDPSTTGTSLNRRLYVEQDADDNVTSLTDGTGAVVERYASDPYGSVTVENPDGTVRGDGTSSASDYGWTVLHQGLQLDVATGTYSDEHRTYLTALGRFAQEDPTGAAYVDGPNIYQLERSSPTGSLDPSGEGDFPGDGAAGGTVVNPSPRAKRDEKGEDEKGDKYI